MELQVLKSFSLEYQKIAAGHAPDEANARMSMVQRAVEMHGDKADLASVRAKIKAKFPDMLKAAMPFFAKAAAELIKNGALANLDWRTGGKAALEEAGPALGAIAGAGLAGATGKSTLGGAALGYGAGSLPELILGGKGHKK